jgi:hypothetical protein
MCNCLWKPRKGAPPKESPDFCGGETSGSQRGVRCGVTFLGVLVILPI